MPPRLSRIAAVFALPALALACAHAQRPAILDKMDKAAAKFSSVSADVTREVVTKIGVINNTEQYTGKIYISRSGDKTRMAATSTQGARVTQVVNYDNGVLQVFSPPPGSDQIDVIKAGSDQAKFDTYLTLTAGVRGTDLEKAWDITDDGPEIIDGKTTEKLELVSKDPGVRNVYPKITIWVDPERGINLKQVFVAKDGGIQTTTYKNIKMGAGFDSNTFAIRKDKDTKTIVH